MRDCDEIVPAPYREAYEALERARLTAIDRKGYVPCSMATATRNATVTEVLGVACYSKTDICPTSLVTAGATTASQHTPGDANKSVGHQHSADMIPLGAL